MEQATCQVCGRTIKANSGLIAHHGYKRPFEGWQTASCEGARYLPYEQSCERLAEVLGMTQTFIANQEKALQDFLVNPPQTIKVVERRGAWSEGVEKTYEKPEGFTVDSYYVSIPRTYENAYHNKKHGYEQTIKLANADVVTMQRRINEWKPVAEKVN